MRIRKLLKSVMLFVPAFKRLVDQRSAALARSQKLEGELSSTMAELSSSKRRLVDVERQLAHSKKVERELASVRRRESDMGEQLEAALKFESELVVVRERAHDLEDQLTQAQRLEIEITALREHAIDLEKQLLRSQKLERNLLSSQAQVYDLKLQLELKKVLESEVADQHKRIAVLEAQIVDTSATLQEAREAFVGAEISREEAEGDLLLERRRVEEVSVKLSAADRHEIFLSDRLASVTGNYRIHKSDEDANFSAQEFAVECDRMRKLIERAGEEFVPSKFWDFYYKVNLQQLNGAGLHNFKLTVSQNYHNYLIGNVFDSKLRRLLRWFRSSENVDLHLLFSSIEDPDYLDQNLFLSHPNHQIFNSRPSARVLYRTYVALLWEFMRSKDRLGLADIMSEPEIGNPIRVTHRGKLISQDLATSIFEANDIAPALTERVGQEPCGIVEIGAGYGRLAHVLKSTLNIRRYVIVDIPPTILVSRWYLSRVFPDAKIFGVEDFTDWREVEGEVADADFVFLLPHQLPLLPDNFVDGAISVSALHEMVPSQANWYLAEMGRTAKHLIYSKQYWKYLNPHDDLEFDVSQYVYPSGFEEALSKGDPFNELFFNKVFLSTPDQISAV